MSDWLQARSIVIAEAGAGFAGTEYNLSKEGIILKAIPHILDIIASNSEESLRKVDIGAGLELRAILEGVTILPEDRSIGNQILRNQDVSFRALKDDGIYRHFFISNVIINKNYDQSFPGGELQYLPIVFNTTDLSVMDILIETELLGYDSGLVPDTFELADSEGELLIGLIHET